MREASILDAIELYDLETAARKIGDHIRGDELRRASMEIVNSLSLDGKELFWEIITERYPK